MKNNKIYVVTVDIFNKEYNFTYLTLLLRTLGQRNKKEYCPMTKSTSGHHTYNINTKSEKRRHFKVYKKRARTDEDVHKKRTNLR